MGGGGTPGPNTEGGGYQPGCPGHCCCNSPNGCCIPGIIGWSGCAGAGVASGIAGRADAGACPVTAAVSSTGCPGILGAAGPGGEVTPAGALISSAGGGAAGVGTAGCACGVAGGCAVVGAGGCAVVGAGAHCWAGICEGAGPGATCRGAPGCSGGGYTCLPAASGGVGSSPWFFLARCLPPLFPSPVSKVSLSSISRQ
jgi:hypothetical protein